MNKYIVHWFYMNPLQKSGKTIIKANSFADAEEDFLNSNIARRLLQKNGTLPEITKIERQ